MPDRSANCDHPIMQKRDEVEARYRRVIRRIEGDDGGRALPAATDSVITAGR